MPSSPLFPPVGTPLSFLLIDVLAVRERILAAEPNLVADIKAGKHGDGDHNAPHVHEAIAYMLIGAETARPAGEWTRLPLAGQVWTMMEIERLNAAAELLANT